MVYIDVVNKFQERGKIFSPETIIMFFLERALRCMGRTLSKMEFYVCKFTIACSPIKKFSMPIVVAFIQQLQGLKLAYIAFDVR